MRSGRSSTPRSPHCASTRRRVSGYVERSWACGQSCCPQADTMSTIGSMTSDGYACTPFGAVNEADDPRCQSESRHRWPSEALLGSSVCDWDEPFVAPQGYPADMSSKPAGAVSFIGGIALLAGCSQDATLVADAGSSDVGRFDGGFGDSGLIAADASPNDLGRPPPPRAGLEWFVEDATGVLVAGIASIEVDGTSEELTIGGEQWRIYYDIATFSPDRALGSARSSSTSLTARLAPERCEGHRTDGTPIHGTLSVCTNRNAGNSPVEGSRVLGFLHYYGDRLELSYAIQIGPDGVLDYSAVENPPGDRSEAAAWAIVEAKWTELGRGL